MKKICRTCQYWNIHSIDMKMGDCMAPGDHRYWHVPITGKTSVAMMDSFGREETKPNFSCAAWRNDRPADLAGDPQLPQVTKGARHD
jgi:hypothetical protein